jgi:hypothetical protein
MTDWTAGLPNRLEPPLHPSLEQVAVDSEGTLSFSCAASAGRLYELQFTNDLSAQGWVSLGVVRAPGPTLRIVQPISGDACRFTE